MDICTIIAKNYVAYARVLARSFVEQHPDSRCYALVIDETADYIDPAREPFELVTPDHLGIERFQSMAARYDVLELSTAVKPWLLRHLLYERGLEKVAYLDPDIEVCASLAEIDELLDEHEIALIPHLTVPLPDDGLKPSEVDILIAGAYNLGFVALARCAPVDAMLAWWSRHLAEHCVVAPERGMFVDQRWMDLVPGLLERIAVVRDPGYDVAYWNLPSRSLTREDAEIVVDGRPLRFMHFSGFDPEEPSRLSKHQNRVEINPGSLLGELCARYAERVLAEGHRDVRAWPYTYAALPDGMPLDRVTRAGYAKAEEEGAVRTSIFEIRGASELLRWLTSAARAGGSQGVNRYLETLHEVYPGLSATFPDLARRGADLVAWARVYGHSEVPIPDALLPGFRSSRALRPAGVNVVGYFDAVLGVGEAARQLISAMHAHDIETATIALHASASPREAALAIESAEARYPVNVICVNADVLPAFAQQAGPSFFSDRVSIGYWWWEVSTFPERWLGSFAFLDEVWAGSRHVADALADVSPVPVVRIPPPVERLQPPRLTREQLGLPEGFLFLFVFDYASVFARKNPLALVDAFKRAFREGEGASLVLKSINHEHDSMSHERLRAAVSERADIHVIDRTVASEEKDAMIAACDCFVSLHRSEGFGFTLAEAMSLGRPVIATRYSGNLDYMTPDNSYLVDFDLVPIGPGADPYPAEGFWAEPDTEHGAALMRAVFDDPDAARARAARGQAELLASHSREAVGAAIARRLVRVQSAGSRSLAGTSALVYGELAKTSERIRKGPVPTQRRTRLGAAQRLARKAVLRLIKPFTVHERIVDEELVRAIAAVGDGLATAHMRIDELSRESTGRGRVDGGHAARPEQAGASVATTARRPSAPRG